MQHTDMITLIKDKATSTSNLLIITNPISFARDYVITHGQERAEFLGEDITLTIITTIEYTEEGVKKITEQNKEEIPLKNLIKEYTEQRKGRNK